MQYHVLQLCTVVSGTAALQPDSRSVDTAVQGLVAVYKQQQDAFEQLYNELDACLLGSARAEGSSQGPADLAASASLAQGKAHSRRPSDAGEAGSHSRRLRVSTGGNGATSGESSPLRRLRTGQVHVPHSSVDSQSAGGSALDNTLSAQDGAGSPTALGADLVRRASRAVSFKTDTLLTMAPLEESRIDPDLASESDDEDDAGLSTISSSDCEPCDKPPDTTFQPELPAASRVAAKSRRVGSRSGMNRAMQSQPFVLRSTGWRAPYASQLYASCLQRNQSHRCGVHA